MKVARDYHLAEVVVDMAKRKCLLGAFLGIGNRIRGLYVDAFVCKVDYEVDFVLAESVFGGKVAA